MRIGLTTSAIWLLAILPGGIALCLVTLSDFATVGSLLNYLGRLAGIVGLSMMLVAALSSIRVPGLDLPFGGLTKVWRVHHQVGTVAFLLLLAHPLLLAFGAAEVSLSAARATLIPGDLAPWLGWLALLAMMIFLAPGFGFWGEPDYQRWKRLHRLSAGAVVLGVAHTLLLVRTPAAPWGTLLWVLVSGAAFAAMGYRFWGARRWGRRPYTVAAVVPKANNLVELSLHPQAAPLRYRAGQFVYLTPLDPQLSAGCGEEHPYTLTSAPDEPVLRFAIKDLGDASRALQRITPGSSVQVEGPYGSFFPERGAEPMLWIAGGIGITPFLSYLRALTCSPRPVDIHLIYCIQDEARGFFVDELREASQTLNGFSLHLHYFYRQGPLDREFVAGVCPDFISRQAFLCGPPALNRIAKTLLLNAGLAPRNIATENFVLL